MLEIIQLTVLFFVLFDPFLSLGVFVVATDNMTILERRRTAFYAIMVAALLSFGTLFFGDALLKLFNTNIDDFKVAGGIILIILGIRMAFGYSLTAEDINKKEKSIHAIAALIATPLLTGPAVMTSTIVLRHDYGILTTASSILVVLAVTGLIFYNSERIYRFLGKKATQVISTFFGLITISWGIGFLRSVIRF